jgi:hypothetical protein
MSINPEAFAPIQPSVLYVVSWDYFEHENRLEGGGGGQEWRFDLMEARRAFEWALKGWGGHPCTVRLTAIPSPGGMVWRDDNDAIFRVVSEALDLIEDPSRYPAVGWTLLAECKWNGGAS